MSINKFTTFACTLVFLLVFTVGSFSVMAQQQKPELLQSSASGFTIDSVFFAEIFLNWQYADSVDGFNVYIANSKTDNYNDFEFLQTIDKSDDSLYHDEKKNYWYAYLENIPVQNREVISIYVTAFKGGIVSEPSNISICYINARQNWSSFEFTSTPNGKANLNEEYVYQFDAKTSIENSTMEFDLINQPDNTTFDKVNKTIKFTPASGGIYYFNLRGSAKDEHGNYAESYQYWEVRVIECEKTSTISGKVTNEDGEKIKYCYATLYMLNSNGKENDSTGMGNIQYVAQMTFEDGGYSFSGLDKGTYYVQMFGYNGINNMEYYSEWFNNAKSFETATAINIGCDETFTADFILEKVPMPNYYKVSGFVKDADTKKGIEYARIDFMGQDSISGSYISYIAFTNSDGYYEASLPDGSDYTAVAYADRTSKDSIIINENMYLPQYWDSKTDPAEADIIHLTGDLDNVNFNLTQLKTYENSVNGYVKNEEGEALQNVLMIAYIIDGTEDVNNMYRGYLAMTNNNGFFEMKNLYPAEYVLLAVPAMNVIYAPGFYKENDFATLTWEDATKVTVGETGTFGAYNLKLQLFEKVIGVGIVKGIVRAETGRVKSSAEFQGKDGLQGVHVHIVDLAGNRIKSTETDKSGSYEFSGLAKGTYKVVIDKIGYKSDNFNVTIDEENKLIDKSVTLVPTGTTKVEENNNVFNSVNVYPNPANNLFAVKFNGNGNTAKLKLFDAQGNIVYSNNISTNLGENIYNIVSSNLSSGTYFIRIEMNDSGILTPVIIVK